MRQPYHRSVNGDYRDRMPKTGETIGFYRRLQGKSQDGNGQLPQGIVPLMADWRRFVAGGGIIRAGLGAIGFPTQARRQGGEGIAPPMMVEGKQVAEGFQNGFARLHVDLPSRRN